MVKKFVQKIIPIVVITLIILYPFILMPIVEKSLNGIYQNNFDIMDDYILKSIRTTILFYYWIEKLTLTFLRPAIMSGVVWFGVKYLAIDQKIIFSHLFKFFLACELVLIIGDYLSVFFNYFQLYNNKILTPTLSPLNILYYLNNKPESTNLINILHGLSVSSFLYFTIIFRFIKSKYGSNMLVTAIFMINLIALYIILELVHPSNLVFGGTF